MSALESTLLSNNTQVGKNTQIGELELEIESESSEFHAVAPELEPTRHLRRFAEDAANLMSEEVQSHGPQPREVEAASHLAMRQLQQPSSTFSRFLRLIRLCCVKYSSCITR